MIKNIRHIGIITSNPEEMVNFYSKLGFVKMYPGIESEKRMKHYVGNGVITRTYKLRAKKVIIEIVCPINKQFVKKDKSYYSEGFSHFSLTVKSMQKTLDDINFRYDQLGKVMFVKDPDGNLIELVEE